MSWLFFYKIQPYRIIFPTINSNVNILALSAGLTH